MNGTEKTTQHLANLFKARFPIIYIQTWEEDRIIKIIQDISNNQDLIKTQRKVYEWSLTRGVVDLTNGERTSKDDLDYGAIADFEELNEDAILIMKDLRFDTVDVNYITRYLRDCASSLVKTEYKKNLVIISPNLEIPTELQKDITIVDFELPNVEEIKQKLDEFINDNWDTGVINLSDDDREKIAKTTQGLTLKEAENAFSRALVERKKFTIDELDIIVEEKCQVIKKTGILEFVKSDLNINDIGGLENLKKWLIKRSNSWLEKAQKDYNLPAPKGVLITGVPGCGKSMTAKAMSALWKLPLIRLDAGKIYDKWVGGSEENIRKAIKTAEAVAPSILWIDEIEKGFDNNDSSIGKRIFGTFLTWLQEKTKPVFVVATANNIEILPPEMLRKGRFDEIFFVDLPTNKERTIIFKLHLSKMLKNSVSSDFVVTDELLKEMVELSDGFSGAEIEQAIISAVFEAFSNNRTLQNEDLIKSIKNTVPLSVTQANKINSIRLWANERAVTATAQNDFEISQQDCNNNFANEESKENLKQNRGGRSIDF